MLVSSWLGCAESVLANSAQKQLSVHEILDGIGQSELLLQDTASYATLAAALFSEIQRPGSKFARNGNKFTLRPCSAQADAPAFPEALSDRALCSRRRRRTSTQSSVVEAPTAMVKLSTTTNPSSRIRSCTSLSLLSYQDSLAAENNQRRIARAEKLYNSEPKSALSKSKPAATKKVRFCLDRNEVFYFTPEAEALDEFPTV
ncbi:hypothetical protein DSO57_1017883 [Entomophthora muscae]|uniref:Uncharacterized protein n=1 Tax=Entomophthora muscae TaxID=34485 RepID=A0ACC2UF66_9FUNG|nr:hypothetical protein DSO57_1017883 [Entomophthora muscae]